MEYYRRKREYLPAVMEAFHSLAAQFDVIVIEGAGSPAEINLKQEDIVNMGLAKLVDAPVLPVGDIDRGGVFAQLYGTVALLKNDERARIKGTIADLMWLRQCGLEAAVQKAASAGTPVFGVCGGYQMLGTSVSDPAQVEAARVTRLAGLGLLEMDTVFRGEKVQSQTEGTFENISGMLAPLNGISYTGYEIHMGRSREALPPLAGSGNVYGSYIHGIFDAPGIADAILKVLCSRKGVDHASLGSFDLHAYKERQYDRLADAVRSGLDMELVYRIINREV